MEHVGTERGIRTNRIELIRMITNLVEDSRIEMIQDRDDAATLAGTIVNGLEDLADTDGIGEESDNEVTLEFATHRLESLAEELDRIAAERGYQSRSKLIRDLATACSEEPGESD